MIWLLNDQLFASSPITAPAHNACASHARQTETWHRPATVSQGRETIKLNSAHNATR